MALPASRPRAEATADADAAPTPAPAQPESQTGFSSHLPLVCIETNGSDLAYGDPRWCELSLVENGNGVNRPTDAPVFTTASTVWVRGQSSARFDKKSYGVEFFTKAGGTKKNDVSMLGMAAGHDWVLHGPYLDKSLVRNRLTYHIARETMFWAPDTRYCEVFLNGEYEGIYLIVEAPRVDEGRIALSDYALLSGETPYLLQRNRPDTDTVIVNSFGSYAGKTFYPLYVRYPVDDKLTAAQLAYITSDISVFERALYADYFADEERGYREYIDMDSFVMYYIITEFTMNKDSGFLSTYCMKDIGGKLMMGPVWDFNNGYDNYNGFPTRPGADGDGFVIADNNWYERMMQDRAFVDAVVAKYRELRQGLLSTEYLLTFIDEAEAELGDAVTRNSERWAQSFDWNYLGIDEDGNPRDIGSHAEAVEKLKEFITVRGAYLDKNIELLYNYCVN